MKEWGKALLADAFFFWVMWQAYMGSTLAYVAIATLVCMTIPTTIMMRASLGERALTERDPKVFEAFAKIRRIMRAHSGKHFGYYDVVTDVLFIIGLVMMGSFILAGIRTIATVWKRISIIESLKVTA